MSEGRWPTLACVVPARDDAKGLPRAVGSILAQSYPGPCEIVIAVGPSEDDTAAVAGRLAAQHSEIVVVENPSGGTAAALNRAIAASSSEVVARVDARAQLGPGYLERAVELLDATGAVNVGGIQEAVGSSDFTEAVAAAMRSRFGAGGARFHLGGEPGPVDTVYLGVFRRTALEAVGGYDEGLIRNQDYELNIRLRQAGGLVYFHPDLWVRYEPRGSLRALARQYLDYGRWKRVVVEQHPRSLKPRQAIPPAAVLANLAGVLIGLWGRRRGWLVPAAYVAATLVASAVAGRGRRPQVAARLPLVYATMHHAWGIGFLLGARRKRRGPA